MEVRGEQVIELGSAPMPGLLVERPRLVRSVIDGLGRSGVIFVCAPSGFGKTALLIQCTEAIEGNPELGSARLVDARGMSSSELEDLLEDVAKGESVSLLAVDNLPDIEESRIPGLVDRLRRLRDAKKMVIVSCDPRRRAVVQAMGDSEKVNASALLVRPDEYASWASALGISNSLDVYALTQGIPSLVVALRTMTSASDGAEQLERAVLELYSSAIERLRGDRDPIVKLVCTMLVLGSGDVAGLNRGGMRVKTELLARLARDYPMFGYDASTRSFCCMGSDGGALGVIRSELARSDKAHFIRAVRMLLKVGRVDAAVERMSRHLEVADCAPIVSDHPMEVVLHGHASFVRSLMERLEQGIGVQIGTPLILAAWASALCMGDYRSARAASADLRRRADEVAGEVRPGDWELALAFGAQWEGCKSTALPEVQALGREHEVPRDATRLRAHLDRIAHVSASLEGAVPEVSAPPPSEDAIVLIDVVERLDACLISALRGEGYGAQGSEEWLEGISKQLMARKLVPLAVRARAIASACRLMQGRPVVDENAFTDASRVAVRESNLDDQMLYLVLEGWQYMALGQVVNAEFRAQQVRKLAGEGQTSLSSWALLLERAAATTNSSRLAVRQEAELIDISNPLEVPEEAWAVALQLSAARYDADLAAWYSLHRALMLGEAVRGRARLAMHLMGEQADSMRRLLPRHMEDAYKLEGDARACAEVIYDKDYERLIREVGQVSINLFGGFHAMRNGHVLTEEIWRRRKATFLAARLALAKGSYVGRQVLLNELWPEADYQRARQNLYVTVTALRQALCQQDEGPQYVVTQAGALALNEEYVSTDLARFDALTRDVLLKRAGVSSRQIVEGCLKLEEIYKGPLFVPEIGNVSYFTRMAKFYESRFVDCMIRGVDAALEDDDVPSAAWIAAAAIRQAPTREDVVRRMMKVMGLEGRRREVVELYSSHLYYLQHELNAEPEEETKALYNRIIEGARAKVLL